MLLIPSSARLDYLLLSIRILKWKYIFRKNAKIKSKLSATKIPALCHGLDEKVTIIPIEARKPVTLSYTCVATWPVSMTENAWIAFQ